MPSSDVHRRYQEVLRILRRLESVAVAFSAGADSTLVLKAALDALGADRVRAVTARSDSVPQAELQDAQRIARDLNAAHDWINTDEFDNENYLSNPENRCYYCKTSLYHHLTQYCTRHGLRAVINGVNADDLGDWRPGIQAAREYHVHAPLADAGITKKDVRELSQWLALPTADKPASPCLSSRVPYGERITSEKLRMIEYGERFLRSLGIRECRVRHHGQLARIEVPPQHLELVLQPDIRARIDQHFRDLGYHYVTLDLRGFRSGSLNEVISLPMATPS